MQKRNYNDRKQFRLDLDGPILPFSAPRTKGLVEALADLLLEAMGQASLQTSMAKGGGDDEDHA